MRKFREWVIHNCLDCIFCLSAKDIRELYYNNGEKSYDLLRYAYKCIYKCNLIETKYKKVKKESASR